MHDWLGAIGIQFQDIQKVVLWVKGCSADAIAALVAPAERNVIPFRWIQIEIFINIDHGIRLRLPGFQLAAGDLCQLIRIIQDNLGVKAVGPPAAAGKHNRRNPRCSSRSYQMIHNMNHPLSGRYRNRRRWHPHRHIAGHPGGCSRTSISHQCFWCRRRAPRCLR